MYSKEITVLDVQNWVILIVLFLLIAAIVYTSHQTSVVFDEENSYLLNVNSSIYDVKNYYEKCEKESGVLTNCQNLIIRKITEISEIKRDDKE